MSVTVETVNSSDTINQGRIKWNSNDDDLANQGNSLEEQQADHIMEGHPDLNYTKAEIGALQTTQDDALDTHKASNDHAATYDALGAAATVNGALNTHKSSNDHAATYDALGAAATVNGALNTHKSSTDHDARYKAAGSVVTEMILDANVTAAKLATDSVETAKIKDANVTHPKLAEDAIETHNIKDANVTAAKLATDSVETAKIKDANVTAAKLATDAVETAKIKDANVTHAKLAPTAVEADNIKLTASNILVGNGDDIAIEVELSGDITMDLNGGVTLSDGAVRAGKIVGSGVGKAVDNLGIGLNASNEIEIKDSGILPEKISHDNNRTKICIPFSITWTVNNGAQIAGIITTSARGFIPGRAGSITKITVSDSTGTQYSEEFEYGTLPFSNTAKLYLELVTSPFEHIDIYVNGSLIEDASINGANFSPNLLGSMELEFDD